MVWFIIGFWNVMVWLYKNFFWFFLVFLYEALEYMVDFYDECAYFIENWEEYLAAFTFDYDLWS
jgi:hypothetical protein